MRKALLVLVVFGMLAAACSESQEDAEAALCNDLGELTTAIQSASNLNPETATVDDVNAATDAVTSAWENVRDSAEDVDNIRFENTEAAADTFRDSVNNIEGESTLPEAYAQVVGAANALQTEVNTINSELTC